MINKTRLSRLLFFMSLLLLVAACGGEDNRWAGLSKVSSSENAEQGEILVAYGEFIARLDETGRRVWTFPDDDDRETEFFATPIYDAERGMVYVGDYSGNVYAIDWEDGNGRKIFEAESGFRLFFFTIGGSTDRIIAPVTIGGDLLFVPDEEGIFAINLETNEVIWKLKTKRAVWSQPVYVPPAAAIEANEDEGIAARPARSARLFVTGLDHRFYNLDPETGAILWECDLEGGAPGQPVYDAEREVVFVGTFASQIVAIDTTAATCTILDRFEAEGWFWEAPTIDEDGILYAGDLQGNVYALRFEDGSFEEHWSRHLSGGKIRARPLVTDNLVVVALEEGIVYALDRADGEQAWSHTVEDRKLFSDLILVERTDDDETEQVIVTATSETDELLLGLRLDNGNQVWNYKHED